MKQGGLFKGSYPPSLHYGSPFSSSFMFPTFQNYSQLPLLRAHAPPPEIGDKKVLKLFAYVVVVVCRQKRPKFKNNGTLCLPPPLARCGPFPLSPKPNLLVCICTLFRTMRPLPSPPPPPHFVHTHSTLSLSLFSLSIFYRVCQGKCARCNTARAIIHSLSSRALGRFLHDTSTLKQQLLYFAISTP